MRINCEDKITRNFSICKRSKFNYHLTESKCLCCGKDFGVHDTAILKPLWKKHSCGNSK